MWTWLITYHVNEEGVALANLEDHHEDNCRTGRKSNNEMVRRWKVFPNMPQAQSPSIVGNQSFLLEGERRIERGKIHIIEAKLVAPGQLSIVYICMSCTSCVRRQSMGSKMTF